jgi:hypothetical protein
MIYLYIGYGLLASAVVFLLFYSSAMQLIKATALSTLVWGGVYGLDYYKQQLGKPIPGYPTYEFVYVKHMTTGEGITLWTWSEEEGSKLYVFPYDQDTAQELEEAEGKMGDGQLQGGSFSDTAERDSPGLEMDDWNSPDTEVTK